MSPARPGHADAGVGDLEPYAGLAFRRALRAAAAAMTPPRSVNLIALPTRLSSTCLSRCASPMHAVGDRRVDVEHQRQALGFRHWRGTAPTTDKPSRAATSDWPVPVRACRPRSSSGRARRSGSPAATRPTTRRSCTSRRWLRVEVRAAQQVERAEHAVHRRADLVAHRRQELRLRQVRRLGGLLGALQRLVGGVGLEAVPYRPHRRLGVNSRVARYIVRPKISDSTASGTDCTLSTNKQTTTIALSSGIASSRNECPTSDRKKAATAVDPVVGLKAGASALVKAPQATPAAAPASAKAG